MTFKCVHCGQCCNDICTQINLNIGDLIRISKFLKCNLSSIMPKISMKPFGDPQQDNKFDIELGLHIPCQFREGERCSIYPARPLNCRIFPHFFIGNIPQDKIKEVIDPSHKCVNDLTYTDEEQKQHKEYADYIGNIILEESKLTDKFMEENKLRQELILPAGIFPPHIDDIVLAKQITEVKIKMAMDIMRKEQYERLQNMLQNFIMKNNSEITTISSDKINEKESNTIPRQGI
jgi:Fe-S-cluster containining protein